MRIIILLLIAQFMLAAPALASEPTSFDSFIQSREVVATLYFDSNAESLTKSERARLAGKIDQLRQAQRDGRMIRVEGFSSRGGDKEKNFILSFFRARAVVDVIEEIGVPSEVALTGYGDLRAVSNDPVKERRVEIASYVKPVGMKRIKIAGKKDNPAPLSSASPQIAPEPVDIDSYRVDQAIRNKIDDKADFADQDDNLDDGLQPGLSQTREEIQKEILDRGYTLWRFSVDPDNAPKISQLQSASRDDLKRGYSQVETRNAPKSSPGLTQSQKAADQELQRGYSQVETTITPKASPGLTQTQKAAEEALQRGYSRLESATEPKASPGLTQAPKAADEELQRGYSKADPEVLPGLTMVVPDQLPAIDALMIEQAIMEKIGLEPATPSGSVTQVNVDYPQ